MYLRHSTSCCSSPWFVVFCLIVGLVPLAESFAQDQPMAEPFSVYVAKTKVYARCGPSAEYYRTDPLRLGQELRVYLETEDGWLGVQPPEKSFCWIPAAAVQVQAGGQDAVVTEHETTCWIGTHLGRARQYRWQVQLTKGERLTILGRSERDGPDGPQTWLRIVPPAGEFRWIRRDQTVSSSEQLVEIMRRQRNAPRPGEHEKVVVAPTPVKHPSRTIKDLGNSIVEAANTVSSRLASSRRNPGGQSQTREPGNLNEAESAGNDLRPLPANEQPSLAAAPAPASEANRKSSSAPLGTEGVVGSGLRDDMTSVAQVAATTPVAEQPQFEPVTDVTDAQFISQPRLHSIGSSTPATEPAPSGWTTGNHRMATSQSPVGQAPIRTASFSGQEQVRYVSAQTIRTIEGETMNATVDQLQVVLSRLMSEGASSAEIGPVIRRAQQIITSSPNQLSATRARLIGQRAEQYQSVALRRDGSTVIREQGIPEIAAQARTPAGSVAPSMSSTRRGGGVETGYLVQVYSARPNSPPFALTDNQGNTLVYVTPTPGLNLRMHLNSKVKLVGNRGFLQGLNMPHLYATQASRSVQ